MGDNKATAGSRERSAESLMPSRIGIVTVLTRISAKAVLIRPANASNVVRVLIGYFDLRVFSDGRSISSPAARM